MQSSSEGQEIVNNAEIPTYKITNRKYPSLIYTFNESIPAIQ
ncbi:8810_t:CDS:1, partial [Cetraspora pellucida]